MNCPVCGDPCRCSPQSENPSASHWTAEAVILALPASEIEAEETEEELRMPGQPPPAAPGTLDSGAPVPEAASREEASRWREELSARLNQYRSRRKPAPPRYPSLRLPFADPCRLSPESGYSAPRPAAYDTVSNRALALDFSQEVARVSEVAARPELTDAELSAPRAPNVPIRSAPLSSAKIIEFPRPSDMPPRAPSDELADPVFDRPRILDVPEVAPPPPALGGITMEAVPTPEMEKRPGIDVPVQTASLARRLTAGAIDALMVMAASALFGYIFSRIAAFRPPLLQMVGLAVGIPTLLWATYQYLMVVYAGSTPGIRLAGLQLDRFDGTVTNRRLRRGRVLASYLSAVSLGMGYAWVLLDEDSLCWHDRITHSYLAPKGR
jgi:uncharacterized RDD family membrane protein YckC